MRFCHVVSILLPLLAGACSAPRQPRVVTNPDASGKIPAIKRAVERKDLSAAAQLVKDLDSDDPAVRFYSIEGLQRLTGETFGYEFYNDEDQRSPAIKRWQAWLDDRGKAQAESGK
jgi:hypothetical protein